MSAKSKRAPAGRGRAKRPQARPQAAQRRAGKLAGAAFGLFLVLVGVAVLLALEIPSKAATAAGEAVGRAGFTVRRVDIKGIKRMAPGPVYEIALGQQSTAMPLVDVDGIRDQLLRFGWVKDARVSRRLPDTLVIDIVERTPAALWQDKQRLALVDGEGIVLDSVPVDKMPDLPLLIGPGANARARDLRELMDNVPTLKPQLASAAWVGRRRWDLTFQSGETIALPEGEKAARDALTRFAKMDRSTGLLGRGLVRFDLRVPGKMIVRLPRAPGESVVPETSDTAAEG